MYRALGPDAQAIRERNRRPSFRRPKQPQRAAERQALVALPSDGRPEVLAAHGEPGGPDRGGEGGGVFRGRVLRAQQKSGREEEKHSSMHELHTTILSACISGQ